MPVIKINLMARPAEEGLPRHSRLSIFEVAALLDGHSLTQQEKLALLRKLRWHRPPVDFNERRRQTLTNCAEAARAFRAQPRQIL